MNQNYKITLKILYTLCNDISLYKMCILFITNLTVKYNASL